MNPTPTKENAGFNGSVVGPRFKQLHPVQARRVVTKLNIHEPTKVPLHGLDHIEIKML